MGKNENDLGKRPRKPSRKPPRKPPSSRKRKAPTKMVFSSDDEAENQTTATLTSSTPITIDNHTPISSTITRPTAQSDNDSAGDGEVKLYVPSNVWSHATRAQDGKTAVCNICNKRIKTNCGSTSTLRIHLIKKHDKIELQLPKNQAIKCSLTPQEKSKLHKLSFQCIIQDGRPFNDLTKPGISKLINAIVPGYRPPHRNSMKKHLRRLKFFHTKKLIDELKGVESICITVDFWSNRRNVSFLVITGHYFVNGFTYKSTILHYCSFDKEHTANNIANIIKAKLKELKIYEKLYSITCDGASNMQKACDLLDSNVKRIWCLAHRLHLIICNGLGIWLKPKQSRSKTKSSSRTTNENDKSDQDDNDDDDMDDSNNLTYNNDANMADDDVSEKQLFSFDSDNEDEIVEHETERTEQETIDDEQSDIEDENIGLDALDEEEIDDNWSQDLLNECEEEDQKIIFNALSKCRALIKFIKKSSILSSYFDTEKHKLKKKRTLQLDVRTRWNSTYYMIDGLLNLKLVMAKMFDDKNHLKIKNKLKQKLNELELTSNEWSVLSLLHDVLKPFYRATQLISG
ncbi:unnamed protein product, partial [Didymodactylos carnosus]